VENLECRFCNVKIVHDGKHWAKLITEPPAVQFATATEMTQALRNCPQAPTMVRFHVPNTPDERVARRGTCIPEVPNG
jgi:hypothetical protein